ncbi:MAG: DUF523 domain-containing protein [Clostridia bacterium]|nr:DUF523 domain-containing protein [Clostridia bacterium]
MILISACLLGVNCKYNGKNNQMPLLRDLPKNLIPICPEQLGGLTTPRPPAEITGGQGDDVLSGEAKVLTKEGVDVTENYIRGAETSLYIAELFGAGKAVLKSKSPSCGHRCIYDGTFSGKLQKGDGVTASLLKKKGLQVYTEEEAPFLFKI